VVNDWDSDGGHDLIGEFYSNLSELQQKSGEVRNHVLDPSKNLVVNLNNKKNAE